MQEKFRYDALPPEGWIRLLVIEPAIHSDEPLNLRLESREFASDTEYEALSYTWGDDHDTASVYIQGKRLAIRKNLLGAVTTLRRPDATLLLWVDAICINQSDIMERNHQVWQMKDIYSKARLVNVWLGDSDIHDESDSGMDFISDFGKALEKRHPTGRIRVGSTWNADTTRTGLVANSTLSEDDFFDYYGYLSLNLGAWSGKNARLQSAIKLLRRSWWKRMWTLQESVLGRQVTVHCGTRCIQMQYFFEFSYFLFLAMAYERRLPLEELPEDMALRAVFRIADLRDHVNGRGHVPTLLAIDSSWNRAATKDEDKIMALLGLVSWRSSVRPEYGWDIGKIYQAAIDSIIIEENNLGFLSLISEDHILRRADLPSWVPDLRLHTQHRSDYLTSLSKAVFHCSLYNASMMGEGERPKIYTEESGSLLFVRGILLDRALTLGWKAPGHGGATFGDGGSSSFEEAWKTIVLDNWAPLLVDTLGGRASDQEIQNDYTGQHAIINIPNKTRPYRRGSIRNSSRAAMAAIDTMSLQWVRMLLDMGEYAPTGEDYLTAFWRCVFVDLKQGLHHGYDPGKPQRLDEDDIYQLSEQFYRNLEDTVEQLFAWWSSFSGHRTTHLRLIEQFNRRFFITQEGYIGLGPHWLGRNDAICILDGGTVAYALRELDGNEWSYVGEW